MQIEFDAESRSLDLVFAAEQELHDYLANARRRNLFLIRLPEALEVGQSVTIHLRAGESSVSVDARVHQVFRSGASEHGVALRPVEELEPASDPAPVETAESAAPPPEPVSEKGEAPRSEMTGASMALEIRRMNVSQRMRLATKAGRLERQILLRDNSPQVLMGLLANPRIDETEVRDLVRSPHAASGVLQHVAKDRRWTSNYEIRLALIRNPKTPTPLAQRLLPTLRNPDLRKLAKSSNVREAIKGAALRLVVGKT